MSVRLIATAAFQSALPPAVLLPESFRGGCSFGAAPYPRDLSCGRAYSPESLAPSAPRGQAVRSAAAVVLVEVDDLGALLEAEDDIEVGRLAAVERDGFFDMVGDPGAFLAAIENDTDRKWALADD